MKFYGQFDIPVDKFIFERYFHDRDISGFFIECGAFDGTTECSCRFFEETMGWKGLNLEPVPWIFERLQTNRPSSRNLMLGLSDENRTVNFHAVNHPQYGRYTTIGSIQHDPNEKARLESFDCTFNEIKIDVINWNTLIEREAFDHVSLMVLDVEGHELSVLSGMQGSPVLPEIMCVEFGHAGFAEIRQLMEALGYVYDIHSFANAYFIRRDIVPLYAFRSSAYSIKVGHDIDRLQPRVQHSDRLVADAHEAIAAAHEEGRRLHKEIAWLRSREAELGRELDTILKSREWKALDAAKRVWFGDHRTGDVPPLGTPVSAGSTTCTSTATPTCLNAVEPQSKVNTNSGYTPDISLNETQVAGADIARIDRLERQLELLENHHVRGFWTTLDRLDELAPRNRRLKCIICDHEAERAELEILTSECIFNGGRLERYKCPQCECVFGAEKFLRSDEKMIDLDYRLFYSRHKEGNTAKLEQRSFRLLSPEPNKVYINWGAGAWNDTTTVLRSEGFDVWGYEPNAEVGIPFVVTHKDALAAALGGIFSNNVIEHFRDPIAQFREFHGLLADGARMVHSSPCYQYLYPFTRFHTVFLTGRSPEVLAMRTGFRIVDRVEDGEYIAVVFEKM